MTRLHRADDETWVGHVDQEKKKKNATKKKAAVDEHWTPPRLMGQLLSRASLPRASVSGGGGALRSRHLRLEASAPREVRLRLPRELRASPLQRRLGGSRRRSLRGEGDNALLSVAAPRRGLQRLRSRGGGTHRTIQCKNKSVGKRIERRRLFGGGNEFGGRLCPARAPEYFGEREGHANKSKNNE